MEDIRLNELMHQDKTNITERERNIKELVKTYYIEYELSTITLEALTKQILSKFLNSNLELAEISEKVKQLVKKRKQDEEYQKKITKYEKLGALKFKKAALKLEELKFKVLHKLLPNYIDNFDKITDLKLQKEITKIKKEVTQRDNIKEKAPILLKPYDKAKKIGKKIGTKKEALNEIIRNKIKINFPQALAFYDEYIKEANFLKGLSPEEKIEKLTRMSKFTKMYARTEHNTRKNKNYHVELSSPNEFEQYLKLNKKIHVRGLVKDAILIPILTALTIAGIPITLPLIAIEILGTVKNIKDVNVLGILENIIALPICLLAGALGVSLTAPLLAIEILSAGINFECINLQNHNMARLSKVRDGLQRRYNRKQNKRMECSEANKVIYEAIKSQDKIPTFEEILARLETKEQVSQMRELLRLKLMEKQKKPKEGQAKQEEKQPSFTEIIDQTKTREQLEEMKKILTINGLSNEQIRGNIK